ncbi:hypothetical protein WJX84_006246 [Apatococcus fuscideae]|uniref:F-box domain-containing protein n=1 Tax=Apatococcus fuscideae TaxID=2026836 RepID=A0AAW1SSR5_9CHLO
MAASRNPLKDANIDMLAVILAQLPTAELLNVSQVSSRFASACEVAFEQECCKRHWQPARKPRGSQAVHRIYPWRALWRQHACRACGCIGEFPVRTTHQGHGMAYLLCRRCTSQDWVQKRLSNSTLYVDLVGLTGKRLLRKQRGPKNSRFAELGL